MAINYSFWSPVPAHVLARKFYILYLFFHKMKYSGPQTFEEIVGLFQKYTSHSY